MAYRALLLLPHVISNCRFGGSKCLFRKRAKFFRKRAKFFQLRDTRLRLQPRYGGTLAIRIGPLKRPLDGLARASELSKIGSLRLMVQVASTSSRWFTIPMRCSNHF